MAGRGPRFGPNGWMRALHPYPELTAGEVDQVTSVWNAQTPAAALTPGPLPEPRRHRGGAVPDLDRGDAGPPRGAEDSPPGLDRADWAFWAAAGDACAAVAAGAWLGPADRNAVAPFAEVMPALRVAPAPGGATASAGARHAAPAALWVAIREIFGPSQEHLR